MNKSSKKCRIEMNKSSKKCRKCSTDSSDNIFSAPIRFLEKRMGATLWISRKRHSDKLCPKSSKKFGRCNSCLKMNPKHKDQPDFDDNQAIVLDISSPIQPYDDLNISTNIHSRISNATIPKQHSRTTTNKTDSETTNLLQNSEENHNTQEDHATDPTDLKQDLVEAQEEQSNDSDLEEYTPYDSEEWDEDYWWSPDDTEISFGGDGQRVSTPEWPREVPTPLTGMEEVTNHSKSIAAENQRTSTPDWSKTTFSQQGEDSGIRTEDKNQIFPSEENDFVDGETVHNGVVEHSSHDSPKRGKCSDIDDPEVVVSDDALVCDKGQFQTSCDHSELVPNNREFSPPKEAKRSPKKSAMFPPNYKVSKELKTKATMHARTWEVMASNLKMAMENDNIFVCDQFLGCALSRSVYDDLVMLKSKGYFGKCPDSEPGVGQSVYLEKSSSRHRHVDCLLALAYNLARCYKTDWKYLTAEVCFCQKGEKPQEIFDFSPEENLQCAMRLVFVPHVQNSVKMTVSSSTTGTVVELETDRLVAFWGDSMDRSISVAPDNNLLVVMWLLR